MDTDARYRQNESESALASLVDREEVLQICYWYQGEGFGNTFSTAVLEPFLKSPPAAIASAFDDLVARGHLSGTGEGYRFTAEGKRLAGRMFADSFAEFQGAAHGECEAGCCDGDDHSQCGDDCTQH